MATIRILFNSTLFIALLSSISCINVPVEFTLEKVIEVEEDTYQNQANSLKDELIGLLDLGTASTPRACEKAFSGWVLEQVYTGFVPKRLVRPTEYGKTSKDALINNCKSVDLSVKVPEAFKKMAEKGLQELPFAFFDVQKVRQDIASKKCTKDYLDPEKQKLALLGMKTLSLENTLNIDAPVYNIYYTTRRIEQAEREEFEAEKKLTESGAIKKLGTTRTFAPGFKGTLPIDFVENSEDKKQALNAFRSFNTDLIAYPAPISSEPLVTQIASESYFIIPKGRLNMRLQMDLEINAGMSNIRCALKNWREF